MDIDMSKILSDIADRKLIYLGSGAGRIVYNMGNGSVVKHAKNRFGIYQNRNEYQLNQMYKGDLLAKVLSVSDDYTILVMQAAKTVIDMKPVLDYFHVKTRKGLFYVPELIDLARNHHLVAREFLVSRNWGLISDKPVIIDYGYVRLPHRRTVL